MEDYAIEIDHVTIRFNMASEKVDNLKEYIIKVDKKRIDISRVFGGQRCLFKIKQRSMGADWYEWFGKINAFKSDQ